MNKTSIQVTNEISSKELKDALEQIKLNYGRGRINLKDIQLLISMSELYLKGETKA